MRFTVYSLLKFQIIKFMAGTFYSGKLLRISLFLIMAGDFTAKMIFFSANISVYGILGRADAGKSTAKNEKNKVVSS